MAPIKKSMMMSLAMVQALNTETPTSTPKANMSRRNADGSYKKNHWVKTISEHIISKIYQHPQPALAVERQYQANPIFQNIERLEFVRNTVPSLLKTYQH